MPHLHLSHLNTAVKIKFVDLKPLSQFEVNNDTLYDFQFVSGLIKPHSAEAVFELYKLNGRISVEAVQKLLRIAYMTLTAMPNLSDIYIGVGDRITVVGDLHGQLGDLLNIVTQNGMPSSSNKYLFNGDFVDRGDCGVECMNLILTLLVAYPGCVYMNRGNHEDFAICNAYGFQVEVYEKYDEVTFGMFMEVFKYLPMFATVNGEAFITHGGLFHARNVTLEELNTKIVRSDFTLLDMPQGGESMEPLSKKDDEEGYYKQMQRDALWSDPCLQNGIHPSPRGAGAQG
jgi:serine/threonine-protein phosphatase with EF-hand domain